MSKTSILKEKQLVADFLKISSRTLNRYIKKHGIAIYAYNKQKSLDLAEVLNKLYGHDSGQVGTLLDKFGQFEDNYVKSYAEKPEEQNIGTAWDKSGQVGTKAENSFLNKQKDNAENFFNLDINENVENFLSSSERFSGEAKIYKNLYEKTLAELKIKQERLEGATYRVGQLEAQLQNTVPLLTYRQKEEEVLKLTETQKAEQHKTQGEIERLGREKATIQIIKNLYFVLLFSFLILTPLFLIYLLNQ